MIAVVINGVSQGITQTRQGQPCGARVASVHGLVLFARVIDCVALAPTEHECQARSISQRPRHTFGDTDLKNCDVTGFMALREGSSDVRWWNPEATAAM